MACYDTTTNCANALNSCTEYNPCITTPGTSLDGICDAAHPAFCASDVPPGGYATPSGICYSDKESCSLGPNRRSSKWV